MPKELEATVTVVHAERMSNDELAAIACQGGEDPLAPEEEEEILQPVEYCTASSRRRTIVC